MYRELIALRKEHLRLFVDGSLKWLHTDDARGLLAYERGLGEQRAIVAFNVSDAPLEAALEAQGRYRLAFPAGGTVSPIGETLKVRLPPRSAMVWVRE
jgi:glycosidase